MKVLDLINASLRLFGYSDVPTAEQAATAREALNLLLSLWENEPLLALHERAQYSTTIGEAEYAFGVGLTWDGAFPCRILRAGVLERGETVEYLASIVSDKEYEEITDKTILGCPWALMPLKSGSTGTVYLYPVPDKIYYVNLLTTKKFPEYSDLVTEVDLPAGYVDALKYSLAVELAPEYESTPSQWVIAQAAAKLAAIKAMNVENPRIVPTRQTGRFDIQTSDFV